MAANRQQSNWFAAEGRSYTKRTVLPSPVGAAAREKLKTVQKTTPPTRGKNETFEIKARPDLDVQHISR